MKIHFALLILLLLFPLTATALGNMNYTTVQITTVTIYKNLSYHVIVKEVKNKTTIANYYYLNYSVIGIKNTTVTVKLSGNFTTNSSKLIGGLGNHTVNLFSKIFSLYYPFIPPFLIYNTSYGIKTNAENLALLYEGTIKFKLNGSNITAYSYLVYFNSSYSQNFDILSDGIVANTTFTLTNATLTLTLASYSTPINITLQSPNLPGINKPYLYIEFIYNSYSKSMVPQYYVEIYYPYQVGDYLAQVNYLVYPQAGNVVVPASVGNIPVLVNFVIAFQPYQDEELSFINNVGTPTLIWNGYNLTLVNTTYITTLNGTQVKTYVYKTTITEKTSNVTSTIYVYFNKDGTMELEKIYTPLYSNPTLEYELVANEYISTNATYVPLTKPLYTTLPYKPINLDTAILITVIFAVVLSVLITLFRQR